MYALIMGAVLEGAKLVTTSWLYRNWQGASWALKTPLLYFTIALMVATSIGVFGFLSKAHLEQGAGTLDNGPKIERLEYQINREKSIIADNEKVIKQLDDTVNSFLGKDRTDRSLAVRKSQAPQRKQLREEIDAAQKRIDALSTEKMSLESEVRKLELEVGPIRYIAELVYGVQEDSTKNVEAAVRMFTLLIVSTLDPLAVVLLIAANYSWARRNDKKEIKKETPALEVSEEIQPIPVAADIQSTEEISPKKEIINEAIPEENKKTEEKSTVGESSRVSVQEFLQTSDSDAPDTETTETGPIYEVLKPSWGLEPEVDSKPVVGIIQPEVSTITPISEQDENEVKEAAEELTRKFSQPWAQQDSVLRELIGNERHFVPKKVHEEKEENGLLSPTGSPSEITDPGRQSNEIYQEGQKGYSSPTTSKTFFAASPKITQVVKKTSPQDQTQEVLDEITKRPTSSVSSDKYPKALSWLKEFRRS